ncbi:hypothetical protein, partial [Neisseria sp. P0018.S001]|uniref:hypothetical protein n=1 Tax=Neisseria sp. P0018.S001 TaxID=3436787 RepID=UPI003F7E02D2
APNTTKHTTQNNDLPLPNFVKLPAATPQIPHPPKTKHHHTTTTYQNTKNNQHTTPTQNNANP